MRPRKPIYMIAEPPTVPGWYAYEHVGTMYFGYFGPEDLQEAQDRYRMSVAVELPEFADYWSSRRLKKRERKAFGAVA